MASDWLTLFCFSALNGKTLNSSLHWTKKLVAKQDFNVFYQVGVFLADRKTKMAALASDSLRQFRFLFCKDWMSLNETWQEARSQHKIPNLCFLDWSVIKMAALICLAETFSTFLQQLNGIKRNFTGCKIPRNLKKQDRNVLFSSLCFSGQSKKPKQNGCLDLWLAETCSTSLHEAHETPMIYIKTR